MKRMNAVVIHRIPVSFEVPEDADSMTIAEAAIAASDGQITENEPEVSSIREEEDA